MNAALRFAALPLVPLAVGCSSPGAVFVTKTSLSFVDVDGTPAEATLGVNRVEGFIAPRNRKGDTPPVLAHLQSDRGWFEPSVQQVYATGTAALRLADPSGRENVGCGEKGCVEDDKTGAPLTFMTSTNIGVRIGLGTSPTAPVDGFVFGYRRKEMSYVPALAQTKDGDYLYPSLIAAIRLRGSQTDPKGFNSCQGFATGAAATKLAERDDAGFGCLDDQTVRQMLTSRDSELRRQAALFSTLRCYAALDAGQRADVRAHARHLGLLGDPSQNAAPEGAKTAPFSLAEDNRTYERQLLDGMPLRTAAAGNAAPAPNHAMLQDELLRLHSEYACRQIEAPAPAQVSLTD